MSGGCGALCWRWAHRAGRAGTEHLEAGTVSEEQGLAKSRLRGGSDGEKQEQMGASQRRLKKVVPAYIRNCKTESQDPTEHGQRYLQFLKNERVPVGWAQIFHMAAQPPPPPP